MIRQIKNNIWQLNFREFGSCVYILDVGKIILIDTSSKEAREELIKDLKELEIETNEIEAIILTHNHWDHNGNIDLFPEAKLYSAHNIKELRLAFPYFKVIETPGHTRDSICLLYGDILFSGDTIFHNGNIGRTDLPESNPKKMQESIEKIKKIPYKILCPGHLV